MRRLAWLTAILLFVAAPVFAQTGWTRQELEGGLVSVNMPVTPTKTGDKATTDSGVEIPTTVYMAISGDTVAVVMISPIPGVTDVKTAFDYVVATRIGPANLVSRTDLTVDGYPAMNVVFRQDGVMVYDLVVYREGQLFQFLTGAEVSAPKPAHADAFHASVKFKAH